MKKFEDSYLTVTDYNAGIYNVGNKLYVRKINALLESSISKIPTEWNFHKDLYSDRIKLVNNYDISLTDLYKTRAQQLRDKYDYLVLCYSGGSDSHNILHSFIKNNIKVDEVVCDYPVKLIEQTNYSLTTDKNHQNFISEWFLTVKPDFEQLQITNPEIKISFLDSFSDVTQLTYQESISFCSEPAHYSTVKRWKNIANHVNGIKNKNKIALIMAVDKPIVYATDKYYGFLFVDPPTNIKPDILHTDRCTMEFFYWSPDLLDIPIVQARKMWDFLLQHKTFTKDVFNKQKLGKRISWSRTEGFNDLTNTICYPYWHHARHQVDKGSFHHGQYKIFSEKFNNYDFMKSSAQNLQEVYRQLDPTMTLQNGKNFDLDTKLFNNFHPIGLLPADWL
jgi:hypothetical protein